MEQAEILPVDAMLTGSAVAAEAVENAKNSGILVELVLEVIDVFLLHVS